MLHIGAVLSELTNTGWLLPATRRFVSSEKRSKICANTRCYVFGFCPNVFRQCQQDFTHEILCSFYATTVHSIIHILDFCGLFAIDVLF